MPVALVRFALMPLAVLLLLVAAWTWVTLNWVYSEGERAGYVQKFSSKGWLCKTWEGEIAMVTMPGAIPEKFHFTVREAAVAKRINDLAGRRVVLSYEQHRFIPVTCFGDTEYFVVDVRAVEETPSTSAVPPLVPGTLVQPR